MTTDYSKRHYKAAIVDADSILYKVAATGTITTYKLYTPEGELEGEYPSDKDVKNKLQELKDFLEFPEEIVKQYTKEKVEEYRDFDYVINAYEKFVGRLKKAVSADNWVFYIGEGEVDRASVATLYEYKASRKNVPKPHHFYQLKDYVKNLPDTRIVKGLEVDDMVSMITYDDFLKNGENPERVLLFTDKDLRNTAGHAKYNYSDEEWVSDSPEEADYNFAVQMLSGDWSVDGIKGLENCGESTREKYKLGKRSGCGKKSAEKILEDLKGQPLSVLYKRVLECYTDWYSSDGESQYSYKSWKGEDMCKTPEEILDENCELLFMQRYKKQRWLDYKKTLEANFE